MKKSLPDDVTLENVNCPNDCPNDDHLVLSGCDMLHGIPGEFSIYRCRHCGLERTNPRPTADTIGAYYPANYGPYKSDTVATTNSKQILKDFIRGLFGLRSRILPDVRPGRMLEIGCSSGNYMEQARNAGWIVDGIEFSPEAAAIARSKGFNVHTGSLEQLNSSVSEYNIITGWMVLEHLHEPVAALRKLRGWIKHDGFLVVSIPSAESLSRKIFGRYSYDLHLPNHLFHFTPQTLNQVFENTGWKIERIFWQRNCNTLLNSFEYWAIAYSRPVLAKLARWLRVGTLSAPLRVMLSLLLGITRQSGRIEVWASPADSSRLGMVHCSR